MKIQTLLAIFAIALLLGTACGKAPAKQEATPKPAQAETPQAPSEEATEETQVEDTTESDQQGPADEADTAGEKGTTEESGAGTPTAYSNLPNGYPKDVFPVYKPESSEVLGGTHRTMEGVQMYNAVLGSQDDVKTVTQSITDYYKEHSQTFNSMSSDHLMGEKDGWEYSIVINDGKADGYGTLITYTLQKK